MLGERTGVVFLEKMTSKLGPEGSVGVSQKMHILSKGIQSREHGMYEGKKEWLPQGRQAVENGWSVESCLGDQGGKEKGEGSAKRRSEGAK